MTAAGIRPPAVAGTFYPAEKEALHLSIEKHFARARSDSAQRKIAALISPHAGIAYSGATAAQAYKLVAHSDIKRVVLLGVSHRHSFEGAAIVASGAFDTPLGQFPIDSELAKSFSNFQAEDAEEIHRVEHSLELQLPFLFEAIGAVDILPVLFGSTFGIVHRAFADCLVDCLGPGDLVVASTDMSHFLTDQAAQVQDHNSLEILMHQNVEEVIAAAEEGELSMCGVTAVAVAMRYALARGATEWSVLDHRTSAAVSGDYSRVVGYASISMEWTT